MNGPRDGAPIPLSVQVADIGGGGLQGAVAILGALVDVQRRGAGRWLDVSMTDGAMGFLALAFAARQAGEEVTRGDQRLSGRYACYRVYECKDGRYYSVGALEPKFWNALCEVFERPDLVDLQYSDAPETQQAVEEIFRSRTRDEWERALSGREVCCEPVLDLDEVLLHPQIAARRPLDRGAHTPAPRLGEHTDEVLRSVGIERAI